jgi:cytoskeletal protein RodZ
METQPRWIFYDTLKLIVGLVLLLLILDLVFQKPAVTIPVSAGQETQVAVTAASQTPLSPTNTSAPPTAAPTAPPTITATIAMPTATTPPLPTPTSTAASVTATATAEAQPTPTATLSPAATATPAPQSATVDCSLAQPSRLAVGNQANIMMNLNLRQEPGMDKEVIRVGLPDTKIEIIGGPTCTPYQNAAYLWWNVKFPDGQTGWSAEASLSNNFYFLQPVP